MNHDYRREEKSDGWSLMALAAFILAVMLAAVLVLVLLEAK